MTNNTETLENINKTITIKINLLKKISKTIQLKNIYNILENIYDTYLISVIDVIINYYNSYNNSNNIYDCTSIYKHRIDNINIINKIESIYASIDNYITNNNLLTDKIRIDIFNFNNTIFYNPVINIKTREVCSCINNDKINISIVKQMRGR